MDCCQGVCHEETDEVLLTNSFLIGKFQVTFEEYDLFCDETGRSRPETKVGEGEEDR
jgi:formylglycine-generating enzyme required for sulfatase activity